MYREPIQFPEGRMMFRPASGGFMEAMQNVEEIDATPEALKNAVVSVVGETTNVA